MYQFGPVWSHYNDLSWDDSILPPASANPEEWPDSWKVIHYKTYPRLPKIKLEDRSVDQNSLLSVLQDRRSESNFSDSPLTLSQLSSLLVNAVGSRDEKRRPYASAGARYPIEIYPIITKNSPGLSPGIYHFNQTENALDILWEKQLTIPELAELSQTLWLKRAPLIIIFSAVMNRATEKYGERGYRFALLEAGAMAQNLSLVATSLNIRSCPIGRVNPNAINVLLDTNPNEECLIHVLAFGL